MFISSVILITMSEVDCEIAGYYDEPLMKLFREMSRKKASSHVHGTRQPGVRGKIEDRTKRKRKRWGWMLMRVPHPDLRVNPASPKP